jgi:hypothetical protein
MELQSRRHTVQDLSDAIELCFTNGWTDGLPVIPPTADRIEAMLNAAGLDPQRQIAFIENRQVSITAEKVAINAVMAGCKAEYMPVVVAAVEALADPLYSYHGPATSTGGFRGFHGGERSYRSPSRHQLRRQSVRPGLARERNDRAVRYGWSCAM